MQDEILKQAKDKMQKSIEAVNREFGTVRTGKASVHLLDSVKVEAYGTSMPLNQVATVAAPEPRLLIVQAFDKTTVGEIVKGIHKAGLGVNPLVEGQVIRLPIPALNEERRKDLVKRCKTLAEDGRVAVRNIRREANDQIKKAQKDKKISEDQEKETLDKIQKATDETIKKVDELLVKKEKDIMEV